MEFIQILILLQLIRSSFELCELDNTTATCSHQRSPNANPSFGKINSTHVSSIEFVNEPVPWILRQITKDTFDKAPSTDRLVLRNVGLKEISCDGFTIFDSTMKHLHLDDNILESFPSCALRTLWRLQELTLSKNNIVCVPGRIVLSSLLSLDLFENEIFTIDKQMTLDFHKRSQLRMLSLRGNNLQDLNDEFVQFAMLEYIDLSENNVKKFSFLTAPKGVQTLNLASNFLKITNREWSFIMDFKDLKSLNLSRNLINIPLNINFVGNIHSLDMSYNKLRTIDMLNRDIASFKYMSFAHNVIESVSMQDTVLLSTIELDFSFNRLYTIEIDINNCTTCTIKLDHNFLGMLKLLFNSNTSLTLLNISHNSFIEMPDIPWFSKTIDMSHNTLSNSTKQVLEFMESRKSLVALDVSDTRLFCDDSFVDIPEIEINRTLQLKMNSNCVPPYFVCRLKGEGILDLFLENNSLTYIPVCPFRIKFNILSLKRNYISSLKNIHNQVSHGFIYSLDVSENKIVDDRSREMTHFLSNDTSSNEISHMVSTMLCPGFCSMNISNNRLNKATIDVILLGSYNKTEYNITHQKSKQAKGIQFPFVFISLDLSSNYLEVFPNITLNQYNTDQLHHTVIRLNIDLRSNNISKLGTMITCEQSMTDSFEVDIDLSNNNILTLEREFESVIPFEKCRTLAVIAKLSLAYNELREIPTFVRNISVPINGLDLSFNALQTIDRLHNSCMKYLLILNLRNNNIFHISENFFSDMKMLEYLNIANNKLHTLPVSLLSLINLKYLDIASNAISVIPNNGLKHWPHLKEFRYKNNLIICSCSTKWVSNRLLTTDIGHCEYPSGLKGVSPSCTLTQNCGFNQDRFLSKERNHLCTDVDFNFTIIDNRVFCEFESNTTRARVNILKNCQSVWLSVRKEGQLDMSFNIPSNVPGNIICIDVNNNQAWNLTIRKCLWRKSVIQNDKEEIPYIHVSDTDYETIIIIVLLTLGNIVMLLGIIYSILIVKRQRRENHDNPVRIFV